MIMLITIDWDSPRKWDKKKQGNEGCRSCCITNAVVDGVIIAIIVVNKVGLGEHTNSSSNSNSSMGGARGQWSNAENRGDPRSSSRTTQNRHCLWPTVRLGSWPGTTLVTMRQLWDIRILCLITWQPSTGCFSANRICMQITSFWAPATYPAIRGVPHFVYLRDDSYKPNEWRLIVNKTDVCNRYRGLCICTHRMAWQIHRL